MQPTDQDTILDRIKALHMPKYSHLSTTFVPRKMMWEMAQWYKLQNEWPGGDESDWIGNPEIIEHAVSVIASTGISRARLALFPFEVSRDGNTFNHEPYETAISLLRKYNILPDLAIGPFNFPYYPGGRLPQALLEQVNQEMKEANQQNLIIDLQDKPKDQPIKKTLREYGVRLLDWIAKTYGNDPRVGILYLSNEWPDRNLVEHGVGSIEVGADLMTQQIKYLVTHSTKQLALNTNIHPSQFKHINQTLSPLIDLMGDRGVIGLDSYPTREQEIFWLRIANHRYGYWVNELRKRYPYTSFEFTEFQAERWPDEHETAHSWAEMDLDKLKEYYQQSFPSTLESHWEASQILKLGIWGAPALPVLSARGYDFPVRMLRAVADQMAAA